VSRRSTKQRRAAQARAHNQSWLRMESGWASFARQHPDCFRPVVDVVVPTNALLRWVSREVPVIITKSGG